MPPWKRQVSGSDLLPDCRRRAAERAAVVEVEHREDQADRGQPSEGDVLDQPEERHAAQVAEKEWRIADGCECTADIGDHEDEEDDVKAAEADLVHPDVRADEHHRSAGGCATKLASTAPTSRKTTLFTAWPRP